MRFAQAMIYFVSDICLPAIPTMLSVPKEVEREKENHKQEMKNGSGQMVSDSLPVSDTVTQECQSQCYGQLPGTVRQEKQIQRNECSDCCMSFCCNCCLVHQMAVETMDETPNCSNIWVA